MGWVSERPMGRKKGRVAWNAPLPLDVALPALISHLGVVGHVQTVGTEALLVFHGRQPEVRDADLSERVG